MRKAPAKPLESVFCWFDYIEGDVRKKSERNHVQFRPTRIWTLVLELGAAMRSQRLCFTNSQPRTPTLIDQAKRKLDRSVPVAIAICGILLGWLYFCPTPIAPTLDALHDKLMSGLFPVSLTSMLHSYEIESWMRSPATIGTGIFLALLVCIPFLARFLGEGK